MTTSSFGYFRSSRFKSGMMCMQLMQQYVQKSRRTILPRSCLRLMGSRTFSQSSPAGNSGAFTFPSYGGNGLLRGNHAQILQLQLRTRNGLQKLAPEIWRNRNGRRRFHGEWIDDLSVAAHHVVQMRA